MWLPPNRSCEAFFTTAQAKIVAYAWILNLGLDAGQPTFWVDLDSNDAPPFLQHLDRHLISEQVELADGLRCCRKPILQARPQT